MVDAAKAPHCVFVTGMSGAGKSQALHAFEDLGYYVIDNLPSVLIPDLLRVAEDAPLLSGRLCLGVDVRSGGGVQAAVSEIGRLKAHGAQVEVIFFDCDDNELLKRFSTARRPHPLAAESDDLLRCVALERERLADIRSLAGICIDTTSLSVHELRHLLVEHIAASDQPLKMRTRLVSFGFKYGVPIDADLVFDLRFLPNPYFVEHLKHGTGLDTEVASFVMTQPPAVRLLEDLTQLLGWLLPAYAREGKPRLTVAIGCTGGRHRSVAFSERLALALRAALGHAQDIAVRHRERERWSDKAPLHGLV